MHFDGQTFEPHHDLARLSTQLKRVEAAMLGGSWFTLRELQALCGGSEAGISARIRDLKKQRFGGYIIDRERRGDPKRGMFVYRLHKPEPIDTLFEM
jgi:hypothetical protein